MKAKFDYGRSTRQQSASVRLHKKNKLDPIKDNFLKLIMQYSCFFFQARGKIETICTALFLQHAQQLLLFFQNPALDQESNPHLILNHIRFLGR
jgi:hypothetical protein